ncbi:MAG: thiamine phosphate synthase [Methyloceanibacter sp.]
MVGAAPPCQPYLMLPARSSAKVERSLAEALAVAEIACVLRCGDGAETDPAWDLHLRELTLRHDVAFIIEGDVERAESVGADGVQIAADVSRYQLARAHLGQRAIIGIGCGASRHDAMVLAELGADYVAFGPALARVEREREERAELIAWWSEAFEVPCVALNVETLAEAERLAALGADFVAMSASIWQEEDAVKLVAELSAGLRDARTET